MIGLFSLTVLYGRNAAENWTTESFASVLIV